MSKVIKISEFKASCIGILKKLNRKDSGPLIVTSRNEPIAIIYPYRKAMLKRKLGCKTGSATILGDIIMTDGSSEWESLK